MLFDRKQKAVESLIARYLECVEECLACLTACVDQVHARSRAEVIIVTPPPMPGRPDASRPYARAAKQVGLR